MVDGSLFAETQKNRHALNAHLASQNEASPGERGERGALQSGPHTMLVGSSGSSSDGDSSSAFTASTAGAYTSEPNEHRDSTPPPAAAAAAAAGAFGSTRAMAAAPTPLLLRLTRLASPVCCAGRPLTRRNRTPTRAPTPTRPPR